MTFNPYDTLQAADERAEELRDELADLDAWLESLSTEERNEWLADRAATRERLSVERDRAERRVSAILSVRGGRRAVRA